MDRFDISPRSLPVFRNSWDLPVYLLGSAAAPAQAAIDLDRAYPHHRRPNTFGRSHPRFGPDTPVWAGFGQAKFSPAADPKTREPYTIAKDGFRATFYEMVGQYGTHVDPPAHFAENGITMDKIPLKQMILRLVVLDDTPFLAKDPNHAFSVADLKAWEHEHGRVPKGAFAALRTDMYKDGTQSGTFQAQPVSGLVLRDHQISLRTARRDRDRPRAMDTDTTDKMDSETYILAARPLSDRSHGQSRQGAADRRLIVVTWPKVKNGLGFPARAFAILPWHSR